MSTAYTDCNKQCCGIEANINPGEGVPASEERTLGAAESLHFYACLPVDLVLELDWAQHPDRNSEHTEFSQKRTVKMEGKEGISYGWLGIHPVCVGLYSCLSAFLYIPIGLWRHGWSWTRSASVWSPGCYFHCGSDLSARSADRWYYGPVNPTPCKADRGTYSSTKRSPLPSASKTQILLQRKEHTWANFSVIIYAVLSMHEDRGFHVGNNEDTMFVLQESSPCLIWANRGTDQNLSDLILNSYQRPWDV